MSYLPRLCGIKPSSKLARMEEKVPIFDALRTAMCIGEPSGKLGLHDPGSGALRTIEKQVTSFTLWLRRHQAAFQIDYSRMIKQLDHYWEKLFADPITVTAPNGENVTLYPQRTNNILEQFFRSIKRSHCRRSECASINKTLKVMLSVTPMMKNLKHP